MKSHFKFQALKSVKAIEQYFAAGAVYYAVQGGSRF